LREQRVEAGAVVFEAGFFAMHAEAHVAGLPADAEFVQQRDEIGIGPVVEDDETGIDRIPAPLVFDVMRVGVAANMAASFKHGDVVILVQVMGQGVAGNAATDDGDFHEFTCSLMRRASRMFDGMSFMSHIRPQTASSLSPYQVGSISHQ